MKSKVPCRRGVVDGWVFKGFGLADFVRRYGFGLTLLKLFLSILVAILYSPIPGVAEARYSTSSRQVPLSAAPIFSSSFLGSSSLFFLLKQVPGPGVLALFSLSQISSMYVFLQDVACFLLKAGLTAPGNTSSLYLPTPGTYLLVLQRSLRQWPRWVALGRILGIRLPQLKQVLGESSLKCYHSQLRSTVSNMSRICSVGSVPNRMGLADWGLRIAKNRNYYQSNMEKSKGVFVKRAYKPSSVKIKQASMFPLQQVAQAISFKKNKENTKPSLFGAQPIDKQAIFQELQHVKDSILELQDRNMVLSEQNAYLEKQLLHTQPLNPSSSSTTTKTHLRQAVIRQIQELKLKSQQQTQELERLKRSPKYTAFLQLQIEKNVCLEQLENLRSRLKEQSQEKKLRRKCNREIRRKMEEREALIVRMRESITRENAKLKGLLDTLIVNNTAGEGKLRELQLRNARYKTEIEQLQKDINERQTKAAPVVNILNSVHMRNIALEVALRALKLNISMKDVEEEIKSMLSVGKFDSFDGKAIGYQNCQQLKQSIKSQKDTKPFLQFVKKKHTLCLQISNLPCHPLSLTEKHRLLGKLTQLSCTSISIDRLRDILRELSLDPQRVGMRLVLDSMICEDNLLKKLRVQSMIESLGEQGQVKIQGARGTEEARLVELPQKKLVRVVEEQKDEEQKDEEQKDEEQKDKEDDRISMQNTYNNTRKDVEAADEEEYGMEFDDVEIEMGKAIKKQISEEYQDYDEDYEEEDQQQVEIVPQSSDIFRAHPTSSGKLLTKPASSIPVVEQQYQEDFSCEQLPPEPSIKHLVEPSHCNSPPQPILSSPPSPCGSEFYHKIYQNSLSNLNQPPLSSKKLSKNNLSRKSLDVPQEIFITKFVTQQFRKLQEEIISERLMSVKKLGGSVLAVEEQRQIERTQKEELQTEIEYQCCLEGKAMLETLYMRLLEEEEEEGEDQTDTERKYREQSKEFLENIYQQLEGKLESLDVQRSADDGIRNFIGNMYKKVTNQAIISGTSSSIGSDDEGRTSLFIQQYLKAFEKNFSFT